jgi:hypothetical protein
MSWLAVLGPLAKALAKGMDLLDPRLREVVRWRKAIDMAERYIHAHDEIEQLEAKVKFSGEQLTRKEMKRLSWLKSRLKWYKKMFFHYN